MIVCNPLGHDPEGAPLIGPLFPAGRGGDTAPLSTAFLANSNIPVI